MKITNDTPISQRPTEVLAPCGAPVWVLSADGYYEHAAHPDDALRCLDCAPLLAVETHACAMCGVNDTLVGINGLWYCAAHVDDGMRRAIAPLRAIAALKERP